MPKLKMSEARYNDLVYVTLKYFFFEPAGFSSPRQCDIRICMDMGHPELLKGKGIEAAILLPNEVAPKDHVKEYEIDTDRVLTACIDYLQDHWMKCEFEKSDREKIDEMFPKLVEAIMKTPEADCAKEEG